MGMEAFFSLIKTIIIVFGILVALFLILLAIPQTCFRATMLEIFGWTGVGAGALLTVSPVDIIPDFVPVLGWGDDVVYLLAAILCGALAYTQRQHRRQQA
jgi:uncharacterized membrane protein YkvA (DUF1232 family)